MAIKLIQSIGVIKTDPNVMFNVVLESNPKGIGMPNTPAMNAAGNSVTIKNIATAKSAYIPVADVHTRIPQRFVRNAKLRRNKRTVSNI